MQMENVCHILKTKKNTNFILTKLTMYCIYEKVTHDIIWYLYDCNHGNKIILAMLGGFVVSSMENYNQL